MVRRQDLQTRQPENTTPWEVDPVHSAVSFSIRHLMFATVRGRFKALQASIHLDGEDPARSSVQAEIEVASIDTGVQDRDDHLRSADFFHAQEHPVIRFRSTEVQPLAKDRARVVGDLTLRGTTKPVELEVVRDGVATDPWGNTRAAYTATGSIDRRDFGLTWNQALEAGGVVVGDKVKIQIEVQAVKKQE